jgi:RNA polymerase sigma-70 factor (ECF subfamily)
MEGMHEPDMAGAACWGELLAAQRDRLRKMVALRLDQRLKPRVDPSDVLQDVFLEATDRRQEFLSLPDPMPLFLWLRLLTGQRIQILHRRHLRTQARDVGREVPLEERRVPEASSAALAAWLVGRDTSASEAAMRAERNLRLEHALEAMDATDREVLALRHFEELSNAECARELGLSESAATKRYIRALRRLKANLGSLPGDWGL